MGTYGELNDAFARAYNRIVGAVGKGSFQMQVLGKFPLVLTTQSVKDIAIAFGFDESLLIPPANKRTRAQQAIANTQHIGLMLRQGHAAQVGAQQQHGLAPEVRASPAAPVPPTPVPAQVAVPVTPGNGQQVIYEVRPPQTPVPNRRRLPPVVPLRLLLHLSLLLLAHQTQLPLALLLSLEHRLCHQLPCLLQMPVLAAGPVASAQASAAASIAPGASAPDTGANGLPVAASAAAPGDIGDSNAAEPPAANDQVQAESRQAENESRLLRVICQSHMVSTPIA